MGPVNWSPLVHQGLAAARVISSRRQHAVQWWSIAFQAGSMHWMGAVIELLCCLKVCGCGFKSWEFRQFALGRVCLLGSSQKTILTYFGSCWTNIRLAHAVPMIKPQRTTDWRTLFQLPSRCALPIGACCSDDLATAHYRLAHAVPMVGLRPTTEPKHIFYWDYN